MAVKKQFSSFKELTANTKTPVLVVFYATWCGSCQLMAPILEKVKTQIGERLQIIKINADKYPDLASEHQVQALPTSVLFQDGEPVLRIKGVLQAPQLLQKLQEYL